MKLEGLVERLTGTLQAGRAFGPAMERGDVTIIPVAIVAGGGGGGGGPTGESDDGSGEPIINGGGGYGGVTFPLGVYAIRGDTVKFVPAIDATRIAIAGLGIFKLALKVRAARNQHRH